jgi:serine/threonine-protein kinase
MSHLDLTQVGKYQILDLIGEGAMGVVYRALDPVLNRVVAIKVMGDAVARNDELRDRFLREAQAAGSLQHPNVITIFDFGEVDGHLFIAMEYLEGHDLEYILRQHVALSLAEKLDIAIDVLSGLAFAHKRGLVHRDVKPANIRVVEGGGAKIMDFGIVHLESSRMTRTGIAMGTPDYMAPEQVTGDRITPATDIFAMGSVLYELLTGARPFRAETLHSVMYKIVSEEPTPLDKVLPGLPRELLPVLARALAKDPAKRYATALEFANALTGVRATLAGEAPTTRTLSLRTSIDDGLAAKARASDSVRGRLSRLAPLPRVVGIAAGALLVAGGGWVLTNRSGQTPDAPAPAQAGAPHRASLGTIIPAAPSPGGGSTSAAPPAATTATAPRETAPAAVQPRTDDARALALFRSLEGTAEQVRQRTAASGVPRARLAAGDAHQRRAVTLAGEGRPRDASSQLAQAINAWSAAERGWIAEQAARAKEAPRSVADGARAGADPARGGAPATPEQTATQPAPVVVTPPPAPVQQQLAPRATPTLPAPEPDPAIAAEAGIRSAVAAYARAIESRDLGAVRRANPGLTATQQNGFEQFFKAVRSLRATFTVASTDVNGATAEARLTGAYDFVTTSGQSVNQPLNFQASLRREGGTWRLVAVK